MSHGHSHGHEKSDFFTKFSAFGEFIGSFISDAYWMASIYDLGNSKDPEMLGVTKPALIFGLTVAALSASGAAYCHYRLNKNHQKTSSNEESNPLMASTSLIAGTSIQNAGNYLGSYCGLSIAVKIALIGDWISHTGDIAGPITFVAKLAGAKDTGNIVTTCAATVFGAVTSIANVRTCAQNMMKPKLGG
jgi:hypothetical protein